MLKFAHVHIICRDLEPMIAFWRDALGARFVAYRDFGDKKGAIMECGGVQVFFKVDPAAAPLQPGTVGYEHFGFEAQDLDAAVDRLAREFACEVVSIASRQQSGLRVAFVRGPENMLFEIMGVC